MKSLIQHKWIWSVLIVLFVGACSKSGLQLATVSGTVTYKGKPLTHGKVVLVPQKGTKGPMGSGTIESDGKYTIKTVNQIGAIIGTHKVIVDCRKKLTPEEAKALKVPESLIPESYNSAGTTPLELTVPEGGTDFNIELE